VSVDPTNPARSRFFTKEGAPVFNEGDYLVFNNVPSAFLPRFPRMPQVIKKETISGVVYYYVSYAMPGGGTFEPANMLVTTRSPTYSQIDRYDWAFERFSEHKTGRPFGSLRGRSRASTLRR